MKCKGYDINSSKYPVFLKKQLDVSIVGQERYKREIVMGIYKHLRYGLRPSILVIGPSGCGKTFCIEELKRIKGRGGIPSNYSIMIYDASRITQTGISGPDVTDIINQFKMICREDHNTDFTGIVFLDEIDKILYPNTCSSGENMNATVQSQLLNIISGTNLCGIDTNRILFIMGGAFTRLDDLQESQSKNPLGFGQSKVEENRLDDTLREKLAQLGGQTELLGRIGKIVKLEKLSRIELKALLLHPDNGIIARKKKEYEQEGLSLEFAEDVYDEIIKKVVDENLGARSLSNVVDSILEGSEYYAIEKDYSLIRITSDSVKTGEPEYFENKLTDKLK